MRHIERNRTDSFGVVSFCGRRLYGTGADWDTVHSAPLRAQCLRCLVGARDQARRQSQYWAEKVDVATRAILREERRRETIPAWVFGRRRARAAGMDGK